MVPRDGAVSAPAALVGAVGSCWMQRRRLFTAHEEMDYRTEEIVSKRQALGPREDAVLPAHTEDSRKNDAQLLPTAFDTTI